MNPIVPENPLLPQTTLPEQLAPSTQLELVEDWSHHEQVVKQAVRQSIYGDPNLDQADAVSTINVQSWFNHSPWRITAGWSAVAGLLSTGVLTNLFDWRTFFGWQTLVLTLLLVDPLWGSIWRFAWGRDGILPLGKGQQSYSFWLPYLRPNSPAARLMGIYDNASEATGAEAVGNAPSRNEPAHNGSGNNEPSGNGPAGRVAPRVGRRAAVKGDDLAPLLFRVGLPTLFVGYGIAATLGSTALWFTSIVVVCAVLGWLGRRNWGKPSGLLQAIVFTLLPWALMSFLLQQGLTEEQAQYGNIDERIRYGFLLAILWTLHCWGITLARRSEASTSANTLLATEAGQGALVPLAEVSEGSQHSGSRLEQRLATNSIRRLLSAPALPILILADVGMVGLMLNLQEPLWLALLVPLWLPTWLAYIQNSPVDCQPVWRLAALLVSAAAVGLTLVI